MLLTGALYVASTSGGCLYYERILLLPEPSFIAWGAHSVWVADRKSRRVLWDPRGSMSEDPQESAHLRAPWRRPTPQFLRDTCIMCVCGFCFVFGKMNGRVVS